MNISAYEYHIKKKKDVQTQEQIYAAYYLKNKDTTKTCLKKKKTRSKSIKKKVSAINSVQKRSITK